MLTKLIQKLNNASDQKYLFWITFLFYIFLVVTNISNKPIVVSFIVLFFLYFFKFKKLELSLFFTFVSSLIVVVGKTYHLLLIPAGIFSTDIFPYGYYSSLVISASHLVAFAMFMYTIRYLTIYRKTIKFNKLDFLIVLFYLFKIVSALFGSKNSTLSLPYEILSLTNLIAYFYIKFVLKTNQTLWKNLSYLFAAMVLFESILGFRQLINKSPLGKNIEFQVGIEYFGHSIDETPFSFRPVGTFEHANGLGIWTAAVCIFILIQSLSGKSYTLWLSFLAGLALIIVTISRSAWLGISISAIFSILYVFKHYKNLVKPITTYLLKWRFVIVPIFLLLFFFFVIPRAKNSVYSFQKNEGAGGFRFIQNQDAIQSIKSHPILGIGAGMQVFEGISLNSNTLKANLPLEVHNWYLSTALSNGLPALFTIMFFLFYSLKIIFKPKKMPLINVSIASTITCLMVAAIFQPIINIDIILLLMPLLKLNPTIKDGSMNAIDD